MRTETIEIFTFAELTDSAKERARQWFREGGCWHWSDEWWDSAAAFSKIAPIKVRSIHWERAEPEMVWSEDAELSELSGVRAWKWLHNNGWFDLAAENVKGGCTLTGYCGDCAFFDPIEKYARDPMGVPELGDLFRDCVYSWAFAARDDMEWSHSDECVDDTIEANGYEFEACGNFYR